MALKNQIRKVFLGTSLPNEYICLSGSALEDSPKVILDGPEHTDLTSSHILLGYKPLIIGLTHSFSPAARGNSGFTLLFRQGASQLLATLELKRLSDWRMGETDVRICEGVRGSHYFLTNFSKTTNRFYELFRTRKEGNVSLSPSVYNQVRIAYSVPRNISVISVGDRGGFNLFPTDLHGGVGEKFYVSSLRIGGKACEQVERFKQLVISKVSADSYRSIYALGKNHMSELMDIRQFDVAEERSEKLGLPLPATATSYRELVWKNAFDSGIHRIHFYEVINEKRLNDLPELAHIHSFYAQWRIDHGLNAEYLLR